MTALHIRRATVDDLPALRALWAAMRLPADDLERRLKECQVVEDARGAVVGAVGIAFHQQYALLHSEGYLDFGQADAARLLFWDRLQVLAANHGAFRVWTREDAPFWRRHGFQPAGDAALLRLPAPWQAPGRPWLTLQLKDEDAVAAALERRFAGFMDAERRRTTRLSERARTLRRVIIAAGFGIFFICVAILFYLLRYRNPFAR
ncbi:MAG: hypothetical protein KGR98_07810 [Verrucomicrobia bacterium]|nr:hypothetical protein [Verrucomicrobiota bacterium]MDE3098481.1 hypothetical protein [Verrucomicrobiota bacterium]